MFASTATLLLLALILVGFAIGRWRYDVVAMAGLGAGILLGLVPEEEAFSGFGHPAIVTVAAVLVLSRGLSLSGATRMVGRLVMAKGDGRGQIIRLGSVGAILSSVMNNVGALALLLPIAGASRAAASIVLMPLAFATILGGMITAIGTPPNLIIAAARAELNGEPFGMFAFAPVGLIVAVAGVAFIAAIGWRLVPKRGHHSDDDGADTFEMEDYLAEARVREDSAANGKTISQLDADIADLDVKIVGLIRGGRRFPAIARVTPIQPGDILMIEAVPQDLQPFLRKIGLEFVDPGSPMRPLLQSDDIGLVETIVTAGSKLEGRTAISARLQRQYGVNLLAVSRQGRPYRGRLRAFRFQAGDVLLLQGEADRLHDVVGSLGCLPLAERGLKAPPTRPGQSWQAIACFIGAIVLATTGVLSIAVALMAGALAMMALRVIHMQQAYEAIDWSIIVLLAALIPLGGAMETTGATTVITDALLALTANQPAWVVLALVMAATTALTNVLNNAATAVVMAPLAVKIAVDLGASADPFLMGVAISASCAFLTPVGHQNNALVMGPGGYRFGDYWRLGLPLTVLVHVIALPAIMLFWPL